MEDIITVRFETGDEARAAAASLADSVNENDIFILFNNQPGALDSDRDAVRTNDQGGAKGAAKGTATGADSRGIAAGVASPVTGEPAGAVAAAVGGFTGSLAGTAGGLPGEGEGANKAPHAQAGLMLAVRVENANNKQKIIDCLRQHVGRGH
jgi:hypothetical protein